MVYSEEECKSCHRFSMCGDINRSYIDFKTCRLIVCPCIECIVRPMCTRMICYRIMSYYRDKYASDLHTTVLKSIEGEPNNVILTKRM